MAAGYGFPAQWWRGTGAMPSASCPARGQQRRAAAPGRWPGGPVRVRWR